jgi:hypothetical protein
VSGASSTRSPPARRWRWPATRPTSFAASFAGIAPAKTELSIVGSGRYVRVRLQGTEYMSLAEVQVFAPTGAQETWTSCATENALCSFSGVKKVRYGANGSYFTKFAMNSIGCNNATFGDPIYGTVKHCDVASVNSSNLLINVDTTGCNTNVAINNAIGQSFQVSSPTTLDHFGIWIKPELYYTTSYNVELYDGEGTGGAKLATSSTVIVSSQTSGAPSTWYDFAFTAPGISLQANHAYTLKLVSLYQYSGAFSHCGNVYPSGIEYWLGYSTAFSGNDMSFRLYGQ